MSGHSSPLFCSSPPPHFNDGPEDAAATLLERAQRAHDLNPAVDTFFKSHQQAFVNILRRQIELIKSRSQTLRNAEITIFDKTLLALTEPPSDLMNPAAINFYCEEYLNINTGGPVSEITPTLRETVQVPEALKQALSTFSSSDAVTIEPDIHPGAKQLSPLSPIRVGSRKHMEPKLAALWSVYETARTDYLAALDKTDREKTISTAKFLRDTAENIILFLENKNADALMIAELEGTFSHAKTTVVCLTGGKNRKFDKAEVDKLIGVPRGPSRSKHPHRYSHPRPLEMAHPWGSGLIDANGDLPTERHSWSEFRSHTHVAEIHPHRHPSPYHESARDRRYSYGEERASYAMRASEPVHHGRHGDFRQNVSHQIRQLTPETQYRRGPDRRRKDRSASPEPPGREFDAGSHQDHYRSRRSSSRSSDSRYYRPSLRDRFSERRGSEEEEMGNNRARNGTKARRARGPMHRRQHSGVPYGYDAERMVDSYRPARDRDQNDEVGMGEGEV